MLVEGSFLTLRANKSGDMGSEQEEAIKARAYQLWVESGYAHGHDGEHWHQAERELNGVVQTENITEVGPQHDDSVSELPAQDDGPPILDRVPEPAPGRSTEMGSERR